MVHVYNTARISMRACFSQREVCMLSGHASLERATLAREGLWGRGIQRGRTLPL
jgi:hypothetical protein